MQNINRQENKRNKTKTTRHIINLNINKKDNKQNKNKKTTINQKENKNKTFIK